MASDVEYGHPRRLVHKVASGWLVAFDHGEFGASVWWLNSDNTARRRLSGVNVREFVALPAREGAPGEDLFVVTRPARPDGDTSILRASEAALGVGRLTPTSTGYRDDWLVPPGCRVVRRPMDPRFAIPIPMCVCAP